MADRIDRCFEIMRELVLRKKFAHEIDLSDLFKFGEIRCEIETPQHKNGKVHKMLRQMGVFRINTMTFEACAINGSNSHNVCFDNIESFKESLIRVFK